MLTDDEKYLNKIKFMELLAKLNIDLTGISTYLEEHGYFDQPATTQYFKSYAGGLCQQALELYNELAQLCNAYYPGRYTEEDVIKVALFKDIYKTEFYETFTRNVKNEVTGKWESVLGYRVKEERPVFGNLGFSSYMIARKFVDFTDEQIEAICQSSLLSEDASRTRDIFEVLHQYPLVGLTHMAEVVASYMTE